LRLTGLESWRGRLAQELSGGWKQNWRWPTRSCISRESCSWMSRPPGSIRCPVGRCGAFVSDRQQRVALFVTTHYMEEAERCNQIAFISRGRLLKIGTPTELKNSVQGKLLEVQCAPLMKASHHFGKLEGVVGITAYGTMLHLK